MPRRTDIQSILVLGSGPIVIGQAAEFDYSGTQAVKTLRAEGYRVILVNSNPATIMTDPEFADATYVEPLTPDSVERILERERPDALLPTLGGQTALNLAVALSKRGTLARLGVRLIGAQLESIEKAEDRLLFKEAMEKIGLELPRSGYATTLDEARQIAELIGFPIILRPSFTMGGLGGATCPDMDAFLVAAQRGLDLSPTHTILVEESIAGWKEFELEVIRDRADNVIIVCSIENLDPMGVHTGDSITVAPVQTLTDLEYQRLRDAAKKIIREIGVDTGGSNVQFAVDPRTGRMVVIEMNPRVSRSSALASKATGYPIAKVAARLAVGYTLDEIRNDITQVTPASFEPSLDYVVVKIPRFNFEKFPGADQTLNTSMKSIGEAMAMGRTFREAFQKALRSLEVGSSGLDSPYGRDRAGWVYSNAELDDIRQRAAVPGPRRLWFVAEALRAGLSVDAVFAECKFDPWFLREMEALIHAERQFCETVARSGLLSVARETWLQLKRDGFSDLRLARLAGVKEGDIRSLLRELGLRVSYKRVDTCAAEFASATPYMYSSWDGNPADSEVPPPTGKPRVMILGGGPNRIGQGIEFDYCCVHAAFALREAGFETIMVNCNPETVSTDYDTSDRLYFEPLTLEDVLAIHDTEQPLGVILQFGGQTPLKLAEGLAAAGVRILGTSHDAIDVAEDRERFTAFINKLGLRQPDNGVARSRDEAHVVAARIGYPVMVRPSYVLGGRAMEIIHDGAQLDRYITEAVAVSEQRPVLIDRFLRDAIEVDVDALGDGETVLVGGVMEHVEEAGVHSGDSACILPPMGLDAGTVAEIERQTRLMARELGVLGLMNVQFALERGADGRLVVYVLEVNPRASRTVPFVSKAMGFPLAKVASLAMAGKTLREQGVTFPSRPAHYSVKEAVFPFGRFSPSDILLGPEMRSTGEVMGIDPDPGMAFSKAQEAAGNKLPADGTVLVTVRDDDKAEAVDLTRRLLLLGFDVVATEGTARALTAAGLRHQLLPRTQVIDALKAGRIQFVIHTPSAGPLAAADALAIRRQTLMQRVAYVTTMEGARAAVSALESGKVLVPSVFTLQEYHGKKTVPAA